MAENDFRLLCALRGERGPLEVLLLLALDRSDVDAVTGDVFVAVPGAPVAFDRRETLPSKSPSSSPSVSPSAELEPQQKPVEKSVDVLPLLLIRRGRLREVGIRSPCIWQWTPPTE